MFSGGVGWGAAQNSLIKSIQEVEVTIGSGATSATAALGTAVNKNYSIIIFNGCRTPTNCADRAQIDCRIELTSGSLVTGYVNSVSAVGANRIVRGTVIEFYPFALEKPVDHGTISITAGNTIAYGGIPDYTDAFTSDRNLCVYTGATTDAVGDGRRISTGFATLDPFLGNFGGGSIQAQRGPNTTNLVVGYCQFIFAKGVLANKQILRATLSGSGTSQTFSISTVGVLANTLCLWAGTRYVDGFTTEETYGKLDSASRFSLNRIGSFGQPTMHVYILEFNPKWVKGGRQGVVATFVTPNLSVDTALSSVVTGKTLLSYLNHTCTNAFSNIEYTMTTVKTQSSTLNRAERGASSGSGYVPTISCEEFEFR